MHNRRGIVKVILICWVLVLADELNPYHEMEPFNTSYSIQMLKGLFAAAAEHSEQPSYDTMGLNYQGFVMSTTFSSTAFTAMDTELGKYLA